MNRALKRSLDLTIGLLALTLLVPLFLILAGAIRVLLGSPVLFSQMRPGLNARPFTLIKFRTMSDSVGADGSPLPDANRLTRFGKMLRAASLDELPTLINVVRGDMSLVGPRPLLMEYLPLYSTEQARRHEVRPGITGWAQINGRNAISWEEKFALDVWYVENQSLKLDMAILLATFKKVFAREGITQHGHVTTEKFGG